MKKLHIAEYMSFLLGLVVLNGIVTAETHTTASIIIGILLGIYCVTIGTLAVVRGIRR